MTYMITLVPILVAALLIAMARLLCRDGKLLAFDREATVPLRGLMALCVVAGHLDIELGGGERA